jgi:hypothetical protein
MAKTTTTFAIGQSKKRWEGHPTFFAVLISIGSGVSSIGKQFSIWLAPLRSFEN